MGKKSHEIRKKIMRVNKKIFVKIICSLCSFLLLFSGCVRTETGTQPGTTAGRTELSAKHTDPQTDNQCVTVYITRTGTKYHRNRCQYLSNSKIPVDLNKLNLKIYTPCSVCKPPIRN